MKVKTLIDILSKLPLDVDVIYQGGEYKDDYRNVNKATYKDNLGWDKKGVLIE